MSPSRYLDRPKRTYEEAVRAKDTCNRVRDARGDGSDETGHESPFSRLGGAWLSGVVLVFVLAALAGFIVLPSFIPEETVTAEGITTEEIQRLQTIAPAAGPGALPDPN